MLSPGSHLKRLLIQHGFGKQLLESGVIFLNRLQALNLRHRHNAILLTPCVKRGVGNGVFSAEFTGGDSRFSLAENTDDLLAGKTLLQEDVFMELMKTLLTSGCAH
ncbi:hypothetical protein ASE99_08510 [Serratia sp. Leaf51]|nr:hypothetical protein ASE99_08510 [Serratia sp. Leaf51]